METWNILHFFYHGRYGVLITWLVSRCANISFSYAAIFLHDGFNRCNTLWCHHPVCPTGSRRVCSQNWCRSWTAQSTRTLPVVTDMHHHTELPFVYEFQWISPLHYSKTGWQNAVLLWCILQAGPPSSHYYCAVVLHSCIVLPPVCHSSNHQ